MEADARSSARPAASAVAALVAGAVALAAFVGRAAAHDVSASRFDAPLPFPLLLAGAAVTVLATAALLEGSGSVPTLDRRPGVRLPTRPTGALRTAARGAFAVAVVAAVLDGILGPQVAAENAATTFVWPVWLRGLATLAVLVGSVWPTLSPWLTAYELLCRLEGGPIAILGEYPDRLAHWPATLGFVAGVGVVATLTVTPQSPRSTAGVVAGYAAAMLVGGVCFGREWFRRADVLAVLYRSFGRVAVLDEREGRQCESRRRERDRDDGGRHSNGPRVSLRFPWTGCTTPVADASLAAFVVAAVYTVSFDGFTNTPEFQSLLFGTRRALGVGPVASVLLYVAGLLGFLVAFACVAALADRLGRGTEPRHGAGSRSGATSWRGATLAFSPTVLPIAAAYEVAHNYPYVLGNLGRLATLSFRAGGVPVGPIEPLGWLPIEGFWASQVLLVVVGHVVAVVAAHGVAVRRYGGGAGARRGHAPLLALMVGYTVLSLWIVSRPVVSF
ncbi:hypothetical protein [Halorarum salinum]|uniref:Fenitrothion hydrolase n=1 Tax=Halorarum salinum TaxID=2743089 RepID=A0A7D5L8K9_9EURY|nr:hypothetical protein [Halobaculum salinum]QLG60530.1 hypothetical protein HUG12_01715 [Halobaculum salinum]